MERFVIGLMSGVPIGAPEALGAADHLAYLTQVSYRGVVARINVWRPGAWEGKLVDIFREEEPLAYIISSDLPKVLRTLAHAAHDYLWVDYSVWEKPLTGGKK